MNILHIDSSASDAASSHTRRLSAELVARMKAVRSDATVVYRDVVVDPLPHVDLTIREAWSSTDHADEALARTAARSRSLIEELKGADVLVIGAPMYNFTVPSTLKAWIDHVAVAGQTFEYTPEGPRGLLDGKAYLVLSSGGIYSDGPFSPADHLGTYLVTLLGFLGITEVEIIRAEGVAYGPDQDAAAMASAWRQLELIS